eukprot:COSAG02_NODE_308_length_25072_cov_20.906925_10_plen_46_part_00
MAGNPPVRFTPHTIMQPTIGQIVLDYPLSLPTLVAAANGMDLQGA